MDLFVHKGRPATFDGFTHISNMAQVYEGLKDGEFPVRWGGGWARYGWPAPLFAQQTTSYIGAIINFATHDIVLSYNVTILIGAFFSTFFLYIFLRNYVGLYAALAGATVFHFAPYRIINVYVRGAIPEFYASIFIIAILISLFIAFERNKILGYFFLCISIGLLLLTHVFMFVVGSIIFIPYGLFLIVKNKRGAFFNIILAIIMAVLGFGLAAYYILPIFLEVKYLYYGGSNLHYASDNFLSISRFFSDNWQYFAKNEIATRGHILIGGIIEGAIVLFSVLWILYSIICKKSFSKLILIFAAIGLFYISLMLPISEFLYKKIIILGNVQHPWRMLTGYSLIPPLLFAFIIDKSKFRKIFMIAVLLILFFLRFPQLYGKNYTLYPEVSYFVTDDNLHGTILNTIWMGEVRDYPYQKEKVQIIKGDASISNLKITNSSRSYLIDAQSEVRVADYTFYFPGWRVYLNGQEIPIQWQDPSYRGVITYDIQNGKHEIYEVFADTKIRFFSKVISVISIFALFFLFLFKKYLPVFRKF